MIYRRSADGGLQLESTGFGGGRIVVSQGSSGAVYTPLYFLTDHLGSTRAIVSHSGEVLDRSDYYPYGLKWEHPGAQASANRWLFNGKELQTAGLPDGSNYLDFGARIYLPRIARLITLDPLAASMAGSTPYGYCLGNPIRFIDFMGLAPGSPTCDSTLPTIVINGTSGFSGLDMMFFQSLQEQERLKKKEDLELTSAEDAAMEEPISKSPTRQWEYYIPIWGSALMANDSWQNKQYFDAVGWVLIGVGEGLSFGILTLETIGAKSVAINAARMAAVNGSTRIGIEITPKIAKQMGTRGWTNALIENTVKNAYTTRTAINKATGTPATAFFTKEGAYVVQDNFTGQIVQISNRLDPRWIPDASIVKPYIPKR